MKEKIILPIGNAPKPILDLHFPTREQAFIFKNWDTIPAQKIADVLQTVVPNVMKLAKEMGLDFAPKISPYWKTDGLLTIIKNNWHLLPYRQLLSLLDMTQEQFLYLLKEDDALWYKLGQHKPQAEKLCYRELTEKEIAQTKEIFGKPYGAEIYPDYFCFKAHYNTIETLPAHSAMTASSPSKLKLTYLYDAPYGDILLEDEDTTFLDEKLKKLSEKGVNGLWIHCVLYSLVELKGHSKLSFGWQKRIDTLNKIIFRAAKYGIGIYLYLNEPRGMQEDFFTNLPHWKGEYSASPYECYALCTSEPEVLLYLENSCRSLFEKAPGLAGVFTITMSENNTNCFSKTHIDKISCPRCKNRNASDVIAEVNSAIAKGVHSAKPDAKVIVWDWGWNYESLGWEKQWAYDIIKKLPQDVYLMNTSERGIEIDRGSIRVAVSDYSISVVGPGEMAKNAWKTAKERGLKTIAKVQINNSWECSAVPYIPAFLHISRHLEQVKKCNVDGLMLSWTLGGYPTIMMDLLSQIENQSNDDVLNIKSFCTKAFQHPLAYDAISYFDKGLEEFPFSVATLYHAPLCLGVSNPLYLHSTGYHSTMVGYPYDALDIWRGAYPRDVFAMQFQKLCEIWQKGIAILDKINEKNDACKELANMAKTCFIHFKSTQLQSEFYIERDSQSPNLNKMADIASQEESLAMDMLLLQNEDPCLGFEAACRYFYTGQSLKEKIISTRYIQKQLKRQNINKTLS